MRKAFFLYLGLPIVFVIWVFSVNGAEMKNSTEMAGNIDSSGKKASAKAEEWLKNNPAPTSCPAGFHSESGYWYDEVDFFAWSECTKDGFSRDAKGRLRKV